MYHQIPDFPIIEKKGGKGKGHERKLTRVRVVVEGIGIRAEQGEALVLLRVGQVDVRDGKGRVVLVQVAWIELWVQGKKAHVRVAGYRAVPAIRPGHVLRLPV